MWMEVGGCVDISSERTWKWAIGGMEGISFVGYVWAVIKRWGLIP